MKTVSIVGGALFLLGCTNSPEDTAVVHSNLSQSAASVAVEAISLRLPTKAETFAEIMDQAAFVVDALVSDIRYEYSEDSGPWTIATLIDLNGLAGRPPTGTLTIRQMGGPMPDNTTLTASTTTPLVKGKRHVLFVRNTSWNVSPIITGLGFRVETVQDKSVLVDDGGFLVTGLDDSGIRRSSTAAFDGPSLNGGSPSPRQGAESLSAEALAASDLGSAISSLGTSRGLAMGGDFAERPRQILLRGSVSMASASVAPPSISAAQGNTGIDLTGPNSGASK